MGDFAPEDYARADYHVSDLVITLEGEREVLIMDVLDNCLFFWQGFFRRRGCGSALSDKNK